MVLRSFNLYLIPLVVSSVILCSNAAKAATKKIYQFNGNYRTTVNIKPIVGNVSQVFETGVSDDAPYDLGLYEGLTYSVIDDSGNLTFNNNPEVFGVQGYPLGYILFGSGINKLFGTSDASASVNFENLTAQGSGIVNITGGEGIFKNATGTLSFFEEDIVDIGENITLYGLASLNGSIEVTQTVSEPTNITSLIGLGLTGAVFFLRQRQRKFA